MRRSCSTSRIDLLPALPHSSIFRYLQAALRGGFFFSVPIYTPTLRGRVVDRGRCLGSRGASPGTPAPERDLMHEHCHDDDQSLTRDQVLDISVGFLVAGAELAEQGRVNEADRMAVLAQVAMAVAERIQVPVLPDNVVPIGMHIRQGEPD